MRLDPKRGKMHEDVQEHMRVITCHFTEHQIAEMGYWVVKGEFPTRSELMRFAVKTLLLELRKNQQERPPPIETKSIIAQGAMFAALVDHEKKKKFPKKLRL